MTVLLYCIFRSEEAKIRELSHGLRAQPLVMVSTKRMAAVISKFESTGGPVNVADALAYHEVIASFHSKRTVIPIRFGTVFDQPLEIQRLLEVREEKYSTLLEDLDGHVELGIRLIPSALDSPVTRDRYQSTPHEILRRESGGPGTAYLSRRKSVYSEDQSRNHWTNRVVEKYRRPFLGLFKRMNFETSEPGYSPHETPAGLFSLYFLVPRRSVAAFREAFQRLKSQETAKMLLSGPWPPYNFVSPEAGPGKPSVLRQIEQPYTEVDS